ncbi:MAG TPA: glucosidase [Methylomirabilota bacterium]|nr:glucosidase [Methylomirabilota bacterium]
MKTSRQPARTASSTAEGRRLEETRRRTAHWRRWGPYLADRQWGTVREDYSAHGTAWDSFPHDHARSRAYRWGEDGIAGISDNHGRLCFALALWNGRDPIVKERLFGLTGSEGNHGEDVKEYYFYLDSTPTHSYMKALYKYPQAAFPYAALVEESQRRDRRAPEYELIDTGVFDNDRYFDVTVEYAKAAVEDVLVRITVANRGPEPAELHLLPTLWFRNTWAWDPAAARPRLRAVEGTAAIEAEHAQLGRRWLACEGDPMLLFTDNDTNAARLWGTPNAKPYVKDGINDYLVEGRKDAVNPDGVGTKASAHYRLLIPAGRSAVVRLRLSDAPGAAFGHDFEATFTRRIREADEFHATLAPAALSDDARSVMRQAFAGLLWSKQFFHYDVKRWLDGDPAGPPPAASRRQGRNREWEHLFNDDVVSMPDKWEYPWYAAWDLAFHTIPLALVDPEFAKGQLLLFLREWYMHPNGQIPAYEWAFGDVNPPVHAWAALRVYRIERKATGVRDRDFLQRVFHKLLLNFTWWVNRKDAEGKNVFQGGFLGLDNIGVFDRSAPLPTGGHIEQSDGTAWMAMYCLNMLAIALELAREDASYEDVASKFFEHFVYIAHAMDDMGHEGVSLWDEADGFYYDVLHADGHHQPLKVRSLVGLVPLFAVEVLEPAVVDALPGFKRRMQWFIDNRPELRDHVQIVAAADGGERRLLSIVSREQLPRILGFVLDEREFLAPHGIRAVSRHHAEHPYVFRLGDAEHRVDYEPAESSSGLFGGNSNWRGPIWFPMNYLLIESLQKLHHFHGDTLRVPFPSDAAERLNLRDVAAELSRRLARIFLRDAGGRRPVYGGTDKFQSDPHWRDLVLFYEYFHGDNGAGIGASHQTGWTGLVAKLLQQSGE